MTLEENFYRRGTTPALLYDLECWTLKKYVQKMSVVEMRMLR